MKHNIKMIIYFRLQPLHNFQLQQFLNLEEIQENSPDSYLQSIMMRGERETLWERKNLSTTQE